MSAIAIALTLAGCATPYTGPVEVNRFVSEASSELGRGDIAITTASDEQIASLTPVYSAAVQRELERLGYTIRTTEPLSQSAFVRIERGGLKAAGRSGPVNVGVGGSTGSFGSGLGLGVGINLGGGQRPRHVTKLAVRITDYGSGNTLWEGRAELVTSTDSPFADPQANAAVLAEALFRDFPGGNAETVTIDVDQLQGNP